MGLKTPSSPIEGKPFPCDMSSDTSYWSRGSLTRGWNFLIKCIAFSWNTEKLTHQEKYSLAFTTEHSQIRLNIFYLGS